ncbi:hypothetical protein CXB51_007633 [Gossypium anomalum]|uniref:Transmembrane protein n=1 Tax=Gossypium anomalum TaxID=47600 RepID=A0A8J6D662_9ROSI|nr:hypothetical protein CXB51_007633 [Gossypium anomalum]
MIQCGCSPPISFTIPSQHPSFSFLFPELFSTSFYFPFLLPFQETKVGKIKSMADWGPVLVATVLFVLLCPGLLFQIPGKNKVVEFGNMQTSGASVLVHAIIYFGLITIFCLAIGVHIYASQ